ncbi:hypothetical protein MPH_13160 [Macrophomina phaseolina MS6]|uniref:Uncharacterized protein n=1 Tax=Macrophomina phaseolina (strain MS6) TaxID=1126212 RepID=K2R6B6_MACPH|nr:hypothetical protein MPH_13160 [Macrophomina phaseolina MS6]
MKSPDPSLPDPSADIISLKILACSTYVASKSSGGGLEKPKSTSEGTIMWYGSSAGLPAYSICSLCWKGRNSRKDPSKPCRSKRGVAALFSEEKNGEMDGVVIHCCLCRISDVDSEVRDRVDRSFVVSPLR